MNDTVLDARDVTKTNTTAVQTFQSPNFGPLGISTTARSITSARRSVSIPGIRRSTSAS